MMEPNEPWDAMREIAVGDSVTGGALGESVATVHSVAGDFAECLVIEGTIEFGRPSFTERCRNVPTAYLRHFDWDRFKV